jgi:NADPH2:quinone reductase
MLAAMTMAIRIHATGGPEVLRWEEAPVGSPGRGEARVRHTAVGVNFIDTYHRTGLYPLELPATVGMEGAGVVVAVGAGVAEVTVGQRVAYAGGAPGAYAEERLIPAHRLVPLPDDVSDVQAAAMMLKGLTAHYLLRRTYPVKGGDTILLHAAAGGVGLIACQWAKHLGATVIGTVGSDEKAAVASAHGCDHAIVYAREDFVARVRELTGGRGVPVVYDSVGRSTWEGSLDCLAPLGLMVSYGNASGPVPPFAPGILAAKGSLFLTRPTLMTYTARREDLLAAAAELFTVVRSGAVRVEVTGRLPLAEAAEAHRALESRRTTGSIVLLP